MGLVELLVIPFFATVLTVSGEKETHQPSMALVGIVRGPELESLMFELRPQPVAALERHHQGDRQMTDIQALLAGLGREERDEVYRAAAKYAEYSFYRDLGKLPANLERELLESFKKIDADSSAQKAMKDLWAHKLEQDSHAWIGPANPHASNQNPADLFLKGLENATSGVSGAGGQLLGQKLHPDNAQKQNALGSLFKTAGDVAGAAALAGKAPDQAKDKADTHQVEHAHPHDFSHDFDGH